MDTARDVFCRAFPIRAITRECRLQLQECTRIPDLADRHWAENRLSDFNLWDAGVGASARDPNSLDTRLKNDESARDVVISSVDTLAAWARKWKDLALDTSSSPAQTKVSNQDGEHGRKQEKTTIKDTETCTSPLHQEIGVNMLPSQDGDLREDEDADITLEEAKLSIEQILKILVNLGITIRKAGTASRLGNADRTFDESRGEYSDLIEYLTKHLQLLNWISLTPRIDGVDSHGNKRTQIFVPIASEDEKKQASSVRPEQRILINAIAKRAHRFNFHKQRQGKLKATVDERPVLNPTPREDLSQPQSLPAEGDKNESAIEFKISSTEAIKATPLLPSEHSAPATNDLSEFTHDQPLDTAVEETDEAQLPTAIALKADYPKPPELSDDATIFVCPYCFVSLRREFAQIKKWRKHVSQDLKPYTCYFPSCPKDNCFFDIFEAWEAHALSGHRVFRGWMCLFCRGLDIFTEQGAFNEHVKTIHRDAVAEEYWDHVSTACRLYDEPDLERCPVCSIDEEIWKSQKAKYTEFDPGIHSFLRHIGKCMHNFSLHALPSTGLDDSVKEFSGAPTGVSYLDSRSSLSSVSLGFPSRGIDRQGLSKSDLLDVSSHLSNEKVQIWLESLMIKNLAEDSERMLAPIVPRRKLHPADYTVFWICTIHTEYVAAQAFLDEKHDGQEPISTTDQSNYTLGRIGRHNVIIAVESYVRHSISSALSVVRDIVRSFSNIRICLMVGIGGGAPSHKHDIRLGDIVVGVPENGHGGVVQHSFPEAYINQPPTLLRAAVSVLRNHYILEGHQLDKNINAILEKKPELQKNYKRPDPNADRLYKAEITHSRNDEASCATCCGNDPSKLISRPQRDENEDDPAIHYGLVASTNQAIKDAFIRDRLIAERDVLCFEMEAAGLMSQFPCLIIRGICDYSDSHNNKEWQGYAAMAATAYAKDLLCQIPSNKVEAEKRINDILSDSFNSLSYKAHVEELWDSERGHLQEQKDLAEANEEQKCHQLFRLTAGSRGSTYELYKDRVEERVENTCLWFLKHESFQGWLKQDSGLLLVTADPGCGKSVLAKYLIDHYLPRPAAICYFFFKDQDQNTVRQALCALLHQLFSQKPSLIHHALPAFRQLGQDLVSSMPSLWAILENAVKDPQAGPVILVLDALDECCEPDFENLVGNLEFQFGSDQLGHGKLKYLLTCRPYKQIMSKFNRLLHAFPNMHTPGEEEFETISQEVRLVIKYRVNQLSEKKSLSPQVKSHLESRLQQTAHVTYLRVCLVFNRLEKEDFIVTPLAVDSTVSTVESTPEYHPNLADRLNNLGIMLGRWYVQTGEIDGLKEAIKITRQAIISTPDDDYPALAARLENLGILLGQRYEYEQTGNRYVLNEAIEITREATRLTPNSHSNQADTLRYLGTMFMHLYTRTGDMRSLEKAIEKTRRAIDSTPNDNINLADRLYNLGAMLKHQYERKKEVGYLEEAIEIARRAIDSTPDDNKNLADRLYNLGIMLKLRYEHTGEIRHLEEATEIARRAIYPTPDDNTKLADGLNNLGVLLKHWYERTKGTAYLGEAIDIARQALMLTPYNHSSLAQRLNNLGVMLTQWYKQTGETRYLDEAIEIARRHEELQNQRLMNICALQPG